MTRFHTSRIVSLAVLTVAAGLPVAVVAAAPAAAATTYKVTDLGLNFFPSAINDNGVIIGGDQVYSGGTLQLSLIHI